MDNQPIGQVQPRRRAARVLHEEAGQRRRHLLAGLDEEVPAREDPDGAGLVVALGDQAARQLRLEVRLCLGRRREARAEAQASGGTGGAAIVRVDAALARVDKAESAVEAVMAAMKLRKGKPAAVRAWGAYEQGRADGANIRIAAGAALGAGAAGRING